MVTNSEFLDWLAQAAPAGSSLWTTAFLGSPDGAHGWGGWLYNGTPPDRRGVDAYATRNAYFSTAALLAPAGQELKRRKEHFVRLLAVVVDDANPADLEAPPSWVLATSPGRQQIGFFLDADDPDCADQKLCTALVTRVMAGNAGGDKSGNNTVRYVRLPVGQNQKPRPTGHFQCMLTQWAPENRYTLADAAAALGISLEEIRETAYVPEATTSTFTGEQDDKLQTAARNIAEGVDLHDSVNIVAASLIASGTAPGAAVNMLRGMMDASTAARDERFKARYDDIPRAVQTAWDKFKRVTTIYETSVDPQSGEVKREPLFRRAQDLVKNTKAVQYLIDNYVEMDAITLIFGAPGSGKSFVSLDMACCVAAGVPWKNMKVRKAPVYVILGEGFAGYSRRILAWMRENKNDLEDAQLFVSSKSIPLGNAMAGVELGAELDEIIKANGGLTPGMVVIDTLAMNFGDGDENSTKDMNAFIGNINTFIRQKYGTNVVIVHHTGHDSDHARGSSALGGAVDQSFRIKSEGGQVVMSCVKMKDAESPADMVFTIKSMNLGEDSEGAPIIAGVTVAAGNPLAFKVGTAADGKVITAAQVLAVVEAKPGEEQCVPWFQTQLNCGTRMAKSIATAMRDAGLMETVNRVYQITDKGRKSMQNAMMVSGDVGAPAAEPV